MNKQKLNSDIKLLIEKLHADRFDSWKERLAGGSGSDAACEMESAISSFVSAVNKLYDLTDIDLPVDDY